MSLSTIKVSNIIFGNVTVVNSDDGTPMLSPQPSCVEIELIRSKVIEYLESKGHILAHPMQCFVLQDISTRTHSTIKYPTIKNGKLSSKNIELKLLCLTDSEITIRGMFCVTVEIPILPMEVFHSPYFVIVGTNLMTDVMLPRYVADEVFPDWLECESHGITYTELNVFMNTY